MTLKLPRVCGLVRIMQESYVVGYEDLLGDFVLACRGAMSCLKEEERLRFRAWFDKWLGCLLEDPHIGMACPLTLAYFILMHPAK
jgi:hypothetical protein